jgi:undecaprenyl-diphosphatase
MCALVPGVSRSGSTLSAALFLDMKRDDAARFSFLLGIPAIGAAGVFELKHAVHDLGADALPALGVATLVSAVVGYASIAWLLRYLRTRTVFGFSAYRVGLSALLAILLLTQAI